MKTSYKPSILGTDTQASPSPLGFSGAKIKWVGQPQADNPFEIIHISRHQFPIIFQRVTARIESARLIFRCLAECDCLLGGLSPMGMTTRSALVRARPSQLLFKFNRRGSIGKSNGPSTQLSSNLGCKGLIRQFTSRGTTTLGTKSPTDSFEFTQVEPSCFVDSEGGCEFQSFGRSSAGNFFISASGTSATNSGIDTGTWSTKLTSISARAKEAAVEQ